MSRFDPSNTALFKPLPFTMDCGMLCVHSLQIGKVKALSEPCLDMTNYGHFEQCAQLILQCNQTYHATGQDRVEVLWRTILLDLDEFHHPAPKNLGSAFHHWMAYLILKGVRLVKERGEDPAIYLSNLSNLDTLARSDATHTIPTIDFLASCAEKLTKTRK